LREVHTLRTANEKQLARDVVKLATGWQRVLRQRKVPTIGERPDALERIVSCILCGRPAPEPRPARCACGGHWLEL
jgi:hypothetical protein